MTGGFEYIWHGATRVASSAVIFKLVLPRSYPMSAKQGRKQVIQKTREVTKNFDKLLLLRFRLVIRAILATSGASFSRLTSPEFRWFCILRLTFKGKRCATKRRTSFGFVKILLLGSCNVAVVTCPRLFWWVLTIFPSFHVARERLSSTTITISSISGSCWTTLFVCLREASNWVRSNWVLQIALLLLSPKVVESFFEFFEISV